MFQPSDIGHIRAYPFWRVKIGRRTVYVDQLGTLYGKLLPSIPGLIGDTATRAGPRPHERSGASPVHERRARFHPAGFGASTSERCPAAA